MTDKKATSTLTIAQRLHRKAGNIRASNKEHVPARFMYRVAELYLNVLVKLEGNHVEIQRMKDILVKARKVT